MKRFLIPAVALTVVMTTTTLGLAGVTGARTAGTAEGAPVAVAGKISNAPSIAVGSSWTMYYYYPVDGSYEAATCDVMTFITKHAWTSDREGDGGSWAGKVNITDTTGGVWFPDSTFKLKYSSAYSAFVGSQVIDGLDYGPMLLESGTDPMGVGTC
jgi:hypothetical protein